MESIYHLTTRSAWNKAQQDGSYSHPSLQAEGFIHCAKEEQVLGVANSLYRTRDDLIALKIDTKKLESRLQNDCTASGTLFPHIYGPINLDAVEEISELVPGNTGALEWRRDDCNASLADLSQVAKGNEGNFQNLLA